MTALDTAENLSPERAWVIECSRCANEAMSFEMTMPDARADFAEMGWTANQDGYHFCPPCNGVKR